TPNSLDSNPAPRTSNPEITSLTNAPGTGAGGVSPEFTQISEVAPIAPPAPNPPNISRPQDLPPPATPLIQSVQGDSGISPVDGITQNHRPVLQGLAEANTSIQVFLGQTLVGTTQTASNGTWSVQLDAPLSDGQYLLTAQAVNATG